MVPSAGAPAERSFVRMAPLTDTSRWKRSGAPATWSPMSPATHRSSSRATSRGPPEARSRSRPRTSSAPGPSRCGAPSTRSPRSIPRCKGVVTGSAGNHGQSVAYAARARGLTATIFMPERAALAKIAAARESGAEIRLTAASWSTMHRRRPRLRRGGGARLRPPLRRSRGDRGAGHDRAGAARRGPGPLPASWSRSAAEAWPPASRARSRRVGTGSR